MKDFRWSGVALGMAAVMGGVCAAQQAASPVATADRMQAKMILCEGLPCVEARINGGRVIKLALDTGEPTPILDAGMAKELGLTLEPVAGKDGKPMAGVNKTKAETVEAGTLKLHNLGFMVADMSGYMKDGVMPKVDGTLAYGAFKGMVVRMDFGGGTVSVEAGARAGGTCESGKMSLIKFGSYGPPVVTTTGFAVDGKPLTAQVDTMYSGTLLVYPDSAAKLQFAPPADAPSEHFPFTDGGVDMVRGAAKAESFEGKELGKNLPLYFAGPKVHLPEGHFDATVGMGLFQRRVLTFDFANSCFSLEGA